MINPTPFFCGVLNPRRKRNHQTHAASCGVLKRCWIKIKRLSKEISTLASLPFGALAKWGQLSTRKGFTLIELIVVVSIIVTLLGFITISLVRSQQTASLTSTEEVLIAELKQQQLKAMIGDTEGRTTSDFYAIHFEQRSYVTFHGLSYSSSDSSNSIFNLEDNIQFNNPNFDIIFSKLSGTISAATTIEIQDNTNSEVKRIRLNIYGTVTDVESL